MTKLTTLIAEEHLDLVESIIHDSFPDAQVIIDPSPYRQGKCFCTGYIPVILDFGFTWITDVEPFYAMWHHQGYVDRYHLE